MGTVAVPPATMVGLPLSATSVKSDPFPLSATLCVVAESSIVSVPVRLPAAVGTNATCTPQVAPGASDAPQLEATLKSPVATMDSIATARLPLLVSVTAWAALAMPTPCGPKVSAAGALLIDSVPVSPCNATVERRPPAAVTVSAAVFAPEAVGAYVTATVHEAPGASVEEQPVVKGKLAVDNMVRPERAPFALGFMMATVCAALVVLTSWGPKLSVEALSCSAGALTTFWTAIAASDEDTGGGAPSRSCRALPPVSSAEPARLPLMSMAPVMLPPLLGVTLTLSVQLAPAVSVPPQLSVSVKSPLATMSTESMVWPVPLVSVASCGGLACPFGGALNDSVGGLSTSPFGLPKPWSVTT